MLKFNKSTILVLLLFLIFALSACDTVRVNAPIPVNITSPIESNGALAVNIQDQTTPPVDLFFLQLDGNITTLAQNVSFNDKIINITNRSFNGIDVGTFLGLSGRNRYYFGEVLSVSGDLVTLDTPIDFEFITGESVVPTTNNLNVDGSLNTETFFVGTGGIGSNLTFDITRIIFSFITDTGVSLNQFGDLPSLTNGIVMRRVDGDIRNIWNIKNNGEIANQCYDYTPYSSTNPVQGQDGAKFRCTFAGQEKHGVSIRLEPGDSLQVLVQDDLTGLDQFRIVVQGHEVQN